MFLNFILFIYSDDPLCPVKSSIMYKRHLNPKCSRFFQRPSKGESPVNWCTNAPVGHNAIGNMMPTISKSAGLSKRYTNHSLRSTTVHILDSNQFAGRHITSITGHKSETSLKTYTGYTAPNIKRKMSDTITDSLRPEKQLKIVSDSKNKENNIDISNSELVPLSNSQFDNLVSDLCNDDSDFDDILKTFDTIKMINVNIPPSTAGQLPNLSAAGAGSCNLPIPIFNKCSNITINFNLRN